MGKLIGWFAFALKSVILTWGICFFLLVFTSCREDVVIYEPEVIPLAPPEYSSINGFYLLNEGVMGTNKATLDYYDFTMGEYNRNIYGAANPGVVKDLGDVGNDLKIYGNKLYAVINCSNKIEIMDRLSVRRLGQVDIPNCRYIAFHGAYAYVSSYAGPVEINPEYKTKGYVAKIDTATMAIVDWCNVGYQPEELVIANGKIYVTNSGGYRDPHYESTVSVIDLESFEEIKQIEVAPNLHRLRLDGSGNLWLNARGDHETKPSRLFWINLYTEEVGGELDIPVSNFCIEGDSLYLFGSEFNSKTKEDEFTYGIVDVRERKILTRNFITDGTDQEIRLPYGILVNPFTKDIYIADARTYVNAGRLYCLDKEGKQKWNVRTGNIPGQMTFLGELK